MLKFRYPRHSDVANRKAALSVLVQKMVVKWSTMAMIDQGPF